MNHTVDWNNIFKFDISLQKISAFTVASYFWDREDVLNKVDDNFSSVFDASYKQEISRDSASEAGQKVLDYIFQQLNLINYPGNLLPQIKVLVIKIGEKICLWRQYVVRVLKLDVKWAKKIYWTAYGEIDELKIFQDVWLKEGAFLGMRCKCFMENYTFCMVSVYGQENFVSNNFKQIKNKLFEYLPEKYKKQEWKPYEVMTAWICLCMSSDKKDGLETFKSSKKNLAENLFVTCTENTFEFGMKYFWDKLTFNEQQSLSTEKALEFLELNFGSQRGLDDGAVKKELAGKFLFFLVSKMAIVQKSVFISQNFIDLFNFFIESSWPYQELCEKLLNALFSHVPANHEGIIQEIMEHLNGSKAEDSTINFGVKDFYSNLLRITMGKTSKKMKKKLFLGTDLENVKDFYEKGNFHILSLIIKDSDLAVYKPKIFDVGKKYFDNSIQDGDYSRVNEFIEVMNFSDEDLKSFKESVGSISSFLICGDFDRANEYLHWLSDSAEERKEIIDKLDVVGICSVLVRSNRLETADKFLFWRYDDVNDQKNVKKTLRIDKFIRDQIFEIWCGINMLRRYDINLLADLSSKLLNWFFDSEDEIIEFKKSKSGIENLELFIQKYWDTLYYEQSFYRLSDFLRFWLLSNDEIALIRNKIASNINYWIDLFGLEKGDTEMIRCLAHWVYAGKKRKRITMIRGYMNSNRGIELLIKVLKNCRTKSDDCILDFFNEWVTECTNIRSILQQLNRFEGFGMKRKIISQIEEILEDGDKEEYDDASQWDNLFDSEDEKVSDDLNDSYTSDDSSEEDASTI